MHAFRLLLTVAICSFSFAVSLAEKPQTFSAGIAKVDITPAYPVPLSGYAARGSQPVGQVEQQLWARAIAVFDAQGTPRLAGRHAGERSRSGRPGLPCPDVPSERAWTGDGRL